MTKEDIIRSAEQYMEESPGNYVSEAVALSPEQAGLQIFDPPLLAFGMAGDGIFTRFRDSGVIGSRFFLPDRWLPGAKTVISIFLPYSARIKSANAINNEWPATEWLHGRIEGQRFLNELTIHIHGLLTDAGYDSLIPSMKPKFIEGDGLVDAGSAPGGLPASWSERHVAFACGMGTFGLSKGFISGKGICGRLGSIITSLETEYDTRRYEEPYEYCIMCGACISKCPAGAISKGGKDDSLCKTFLDKVMDKHSPWYGCGKCQVGVPCESKAPGLKA